LNSLGENLEKILGGFHHNIRDISTRTRGARRVPTPIEAAALRELVGKGATWYETLLVDEALHAAFLVVARASLSSDDTVRAAQKEFVEQITHGAIDVVGSKVQFTNVIESHVWCSVVAEYLAGLTPANASNPLPQSFANICYPRKSQGRVPSSLSQVNAAGLRHLTLAFSAASAVPSSQRIMLLRLVGAATCPDLWHHSAAVRFSLRPFVASKNWPPAQTTTVSTRLQFDDLRRRWGRKGNW
jgi:hypothetical protein